MAKSEKQKTNYWLSGVKHSGDGWREEDMAIKRQREGYQRDAN